MKNTGMPKSGKGVRGACRGCRRAIGNCAAWCSANRVGRAVLPLDSDMRPERARIAAEANRAVMTMQAHALAEKAIGAVRDRMRAPKLPPTAAPPLEPCPFTVGDLVRCTNDGPDTLLVAGREYTVERVKGEAIGLLGLGGLWLWGRFESAPTIEIRLAPIDHLYAAFTLRLDAAISKAILGDSALADMGLQGSAAAYRQAHQDAVNAARANPFALADEHATQRLHSSDELPPGWRPCEAGMYDRAWWHKDGARVYEVGPAHFNFGLRARNVETGDVAPTMLQAMARALGYEIRCLAGWTDNGVWQWLWPAESPTHELRGFTSADEAARAACERHAARHEPPLSDVQRVEQRLRHEVHPELSLKDLGDSGVQITLRAHAGLPVDTFYLVTNLDFTESGYDAVERGALALLQSLDVKPGRITTHNGYPAAGQTRDEFMEGGTAAGLVRRDHQYGPAEGTSPGMSRRDHQRIEDFHGRRLTTDGDGSARLARSDHTHDIGDALDGVISTIQAGDAAVDGVAHGLARRERVEHKRPIFSKRSCAFCGSQESAAHVCSGGRARCTRGKLHGVDPRSRGAIGDQVVVRSGSSILAEDYSWHYWEKVTTQPGRDWARWDDYRSGRRFER